MIDAITRKTIQRLQNPVFKAYAETYIHIDDDFREQIALFGLPFSENESQNPFNPLVVGLEKKGLTVSNDCKSLHTGWISPSCVTCRKGAETVTFLISTQCPRNCYFCFNPNQLDYEHLLTHTKDVVAELSDYHQKGAFYNDIALTGGEPLMHKPETLAFFTHANKLYPHAYTRLYTSGSFLDEDFLSLLQGINLNEIRFSIKTDDSPEEQADTLAKMKLSLSYIENVVVEMPVAPDNLEQMKELLIKLDAIGVTGINLLEFCFPLNNAEEFSRRGYKIKQTPYRVLYNYWYAGGLPISGSEENCLRLLEFALEENFKLGVHYCSLENKFSGQVFLQNNPHRELSELRTMSDKDHFLKSAKVFGTDAAMLLKYFQTNKRDIYHFDTSDSYLEFPLHYLFQLSSVFPDIEVGISYCVVEQNAGESKLRELRIDLTTPATLDVSTDI